MSAVLVKCCASNGTIHSARVELIPSILVLVSSQPRFVYGELHWLYFAFHNEKTSGSRLLLAQDASYKCPVAFMLSIRALYYICMDSGKG